jgi:protocatechuate 3,4-dioxygenase beta subunit
MPRFMVGPAIQTARKPRTMLHALVYLAQFWRYRMKTEKPFLKLVVDRDPKPDPFDWCPPLDRRAALKSLGIGAVGALAGCGAGSATSGASSTATSVSLSTSATSTTVGSSITLTARVSPSAAGGSITFYNGSTALGTITLSSGVATLTVSFTSVQTASITAVYSGDSSYAASTSSALTITVIASSSGTATTTALSVSTTATTVGATVTLTAQVTPAAVTGTVTFYNGTTELGSSTLSSGLATLAVSFSSAQTASLTAIYAGDSTYATSTSSVVSVAVTATGAACGSGINPVTEGPYWVTDSASGYNRSDITSDIGGTNTQSGVPFTLTLYIYDSENSCVAMENVQIDIWHCNASGIYSGVQNSTNGGGADLTSQSWLRGYQLSDSSGKVTFQTIVPGWYTGRTTHIHIRFRSSYDSSSSGSTNTAQLFFDQTFIDNLDTTVSPYSSLGKNSVTNAGDSIYNSEGGTTILSMSGSASDGYSATFSVYLPLA